MVADGNGRARPTSRDCLNTAQRYAAEAEKHLFWVCHMLARAGEGELAEEARDVRDKAQALAAKVSAAYYGKVKDGK